MDSANRNPQTALQLLCGEVNELDDEFQLYSRGESTKERVGDEISDVMLFCCTLFGALGLDGDTMVREKIGRNNLKYEAQYLQEGELCEVSPLMKRRWRDMKGDQLFNESPYGKKI